MCPQRRGLKEAYSQIEKISGTEKQKVENKQPRGRIK